MCHLLKIGHKMFVVKYGDYIQDSGADYIVSLCSGDGRAMNTRLVLGESHDESHVSVMREHPEVKIAMDSAMKVTRERCDILDRDIVKYYLNIHYLYYTRDYANDLQPEIQRNAQGDKA